MRLFDVKSKVAVLVRDWKKSTYSLGLILIILIRCFVLPIACVSSYACSPFPVVRYSN